MNKNDIKTILEKQLGDIEKTSNVSSLILSVCLIDTLSGFFNGYIGQHGKNKKFFIRFVKRYLPNYNAEDLYTLRCDVVHSFGNSLQFILVDNKDFSNAFPNIQSILGTPIFKVDYLKNELKIALEKYFIDLESDNTLLDNFNKRLNYLGILSPSTLPTVSDLNGKIISKYEDGTDLGDTGLKIMMINPTNVNK